VFGSRAYVEDAFRMLGSLILCTVAASAGESDEAFIRRLDADLVKLTAAYSRMNCAGSIWFFDSPARFRFARFKQDWVYEVYDRSEEWEKRNYGHPVAVIVQGAAQLGIYRQPGGAVYTRSAKYPDFHQTYNALPFLHLERVSGTDFKSLLREWLVKHLRSGAMRVVKDPRTPGRIVIEAGTLPDRAPSHAVNRHHIELQDKGVLAPTLFLDEVKSPGEKDFRVSHQVKFEYDGEWNGVPKLVRCVSWSPHDTKRTAAERFTLPPNYEWVVDPETGLSIQTEPLTPAQLSPKTYGGANVAKPLTGKERSWWWIWLLIVATVLILVGVWLRRRTQAR
jgi:hypothetical protein